MKHVKKILSVALVAGLCLSTVACGSSNQEEENSTADLTSEADFSSEVEEIEAAADNDSSEEDVSADDVLIGVEFFDWSMDLGVDIKNMIDYASEALGCTPMYSENNFDSEQCITNVENLFAAGCEAVIVCNSNDEQMLKIVQVAEKYDGKVFQFFRTLNDDEISETIWNSPAYGGQVYEDEYQVGYTIGMQMVDAGVKNVGLINFTVGDITAETRQSGFVEAFDENDVNIVAETWEVSTGEVATQVTENYLASYPELDGIAVVGGSGEALYAVQNALEANGKTDDVMVSTVDFYSNMTDDLESGALGAIAGGHWCDPFFAYMLAYNYCTGGLTDDDLPVAVTNNMIVITSLEDSKNFDEWFSGDVPPFNTEEIRELAKVYNDAFVVDDIINAASNLSIDDVIARHSNSD